jgi:hypothetical protein
MGVHARAAVTPADGSLVVEDLVLPDPASYQVVVRLFASGICHSQLPDMKYSQSTNSPMTLGHEATGEIVAVASHVTTSSVGDRVFVTWLPRDGGPLARRPDSPVLTRVDGSTVRRFDGSRVTTCSRGPTTLLMRLRRNGLAAAPPERSCSRSRAGVVPRRSCASVAAQPHRSAAWGPRQLSPRRSAAQPPQRCGAAAPERVGTASRCDPHRQRGSRRCGASDPRTHR